MNGIKKVYSLTISWFLEHERQILLLIGFLFIALISFTFGTAKGAKLTQEPIVVNKPMVEPVVIKEDCASDSLTETVLTKEDCVYVGSAKGEKYYPPSCSYAKKIAKENLRCFTSDEDAVNKGYTRSKSCK
ncbi:MAG: hypothetical protein ABFQ53_01835 [Patescibacteria group bacterium]